MENANIRAHKTNHKYEQDLKYIIQETIMSLQLCLAYLIEYQNEHKEIEISTIWLRVMEIIQRLKFRIKINFSIWKKTKLNKHFFESNAQSQKITVLFILVLQLK